MNKTVGIIVAIVAVVALGLTVFVLQDTPDIPGSTTQATDTPASTTAPSASTENPTPKATTDQASDTIDYTNNGFSPETITIKAGTTITIKNDSSRALQFDSNPHPQHTDNPELNIGNISPGQSKSVTVTKAGRHGFHNHSNDDHAGTLIVE